MEKITVPFITGDGVGAEVTPSMQAVVDAALKKAYGDSRSIGWKEVLAGERAFNETGSWLPEETMEAFRTYKVGIKGPLTTPVGGGIRSLNVALRQTLDLYVCLRPVRWYKGVVSPVKEPQKVNMCVFRENTEDIYAGIEWETGTPEAEKFYRFLHDEMGVTKVRFPETSSFGVKPVSKEGTERLVRAACRYALENGLPSVTLVHKGNIMKFTEGGFKKWGYELAEREFGKDIAEGRLVVFLADFFARMWMADHSWRFFFRNLYFFLLSVPYLNIVDWMGIELSHAEAMLMGLVPLLRALLGLYVLFTWIINNRVTRLLTSYVLSMLVFTYFAALIFYDYEIEVNPALHDFGDAIWWASMNLTTVGADIFAVTAVGKILTVLLPTLGMMMFPIFTVYVTQIYTRNRKSDS